MNKYFVGLCVALTTFLAGTVQAEEIGSVDTVFKLFGPDHKIVVEAFDDPDVNNVTCYVSRAKTGGIKGGARLGRGYLRRRHLVSTGWADHPERKDPQ